MLSWLPASFLCANAAVPASAALIMTTRARLLVMFASFTHGEMRATLAHGVADRPCNIESNFSMGV